MQLSRSALAAFVASILLVVSIVALSFVTSRNLISTGNSLDRSHELIERIGRVFSDVQDAETGQRGYLITGEDAYLQPYTAALARLDANLTQLRTQIQDSTPAQQDRVRRLEGEIQARLRILDERIQTARTAGFGQARAEILTGEGKAAMDAVRATVAEVAEAERTRLDGRLADRDDRVLLQGIALALLALLAVGLLAVLFLATRRYLRERRRAAEVAVAEAEARYRRLGDSVPFGVWSTDSNGRLTYVSESFLEYTGLSFEEYRRSGWTHIVPGIDVRAMTAGWRNALERREPWEYQGEIRGADGSTRHLLVRGLPVLDLDGGLSGYAGINLDISERQRVEEQLRLSERRYRSLTEALPAKISWITGDGADEYHNQRWIEYTGLSLEQLRNRGWVNAIHPEDIPPLVEDWQRALRDGTPFEGEFRLRDAGGNYSWHFGRTVPVFDEGGSLALLLGVAIDIERQKKTEAALRQASQAKDEFLGLVSHELRTPLTIILGNATALRRYDKLSPEDRETSIRDIYTESERLQRLIENMLVLSRVERGMDIDPEPVLLQRLVPGLVDAHIRDGSSRKIDTILAGNLPPVAGAPAYVEQVLANLLSNAEKYSPPGSPVEVRLDSLDGHVSVSVCDRGAGLAPDEIERIFEPFFRSERTADSASGIGLGLSVCKRLVEAQGGHMWAKAREGGGTEIGFALPVYEDSEELESAMAQ